MAVGNRMRLLCDPWAAAQLAEFSDRMALPGMESVQTWARVGRALRARFWQRRVTNSVKDRNRPQETQSYAISSLDVPRSESDEAKMRGEGKGLVRVCAAAESGAPLEDN